MKIIYKDAELQHLVERGVSKTYRRYERNENFMNALRRAITFMTDAEDISDIRRISSLHYEQLKGDRSGQSSVRVSNRFAERLLFVETLEGDAIVIDELEMNVTHYGKKK